MTALLAWLNTYQTQLATLGTLSVILLLVTILATPFLVSLLPVDYFRSTQRHRVLPGWTGIAVRIHSTGYVTNQVKKHCFHPVDSP